MFYNANKQCRNHLGKILNCLYDGAVSLPESHEEMEKLLTEAKVQGLIDKCQAGLWNKTSLAAKILISPLPKKKENLQQLQIS